MQALLIFASAYVCRQSSGNIEHAFPALTALQTEIGSGTIALSRARGDINSRDRYIFCSQPTVPFSYAR